MTLKEVDKIREVAALFEEFVPEYANGVVRITSMAREPQVRTKVAVASDDPDIDPVGAVVGPEARRIQAIVQALDGEKFDIVPFDTEPVRFVCSAVAPAVVKRVFLDDDNHSMELIITDDSLESAIGPDGVNLRLAAQLTGWRLDVTRESSHEATLESVREAFGEHADALIRAGYTNLSWVAAASVDDLVEFAGLPPAVAIEMIDRARALGKV